MCIHMSYSLVAQRDSTGDADGCGGEGVELERGRGGGPRFCEIYARSTRDRGKREPAYRRQRASSSDSVAVATPAQ